MLGAAARVGDLTSHAAVPPGPGPESVNLRIDGLPAWQAVADSHDGPPNPIAAGEFTKRIGD